MGVDHYRFRYNAECTSYTIIKDCGLLFLTAIMRYSNKRVSLLYWMHSERRISSSCFKKQFRIQAKLPSSCVNDAQSAVYIRLYCFYENLEVQFSFTWARIYAISYSAYPQALSLWQFYCAALLHITVDLYCTDAFKQRLSCREYH